MSVIQAGLVGNPNCGKTTVFNALTGAKQRIGNWPGVTVERKSGTFTDGKVAVEVVDLPGIYSLLVASQEKSIDEKIACDFVLANTADVIVNVVDACHLERHLYLTTQLLEMRVPLVLAVSMMDLAKKNGIKINLDGLSKRLGCPVVALEAKRGWGITQLKKAMQQVASGHLVPKMPYQYPAVITEAVQELQSEIEDSVAPELHSRLEWLATRLLENDVYVSSLLTPTVANKVVRYNERISKKTNEDADILLADSRYQFIHNLVADTVKTTRKITHQTTRTIDRIVLNRVLGIPIFLFTMYAMFLFAIVLGGAFQDFFDISSNAIFVEGLASLLHYHHAPPWLIVIAADGLGRGINTVLSFIPVIFFMFLFLAFLEESGYMMRAAFVIDRFMRCLGLPGKSFVPLLVGFGCNVPAVMAARTLENPKDRILTILMTPFMSCGARLAVYAIFITAFFPKGGQNIIFSLYLIGIAMAVLTGFIMRNTILPGEVTPLVMEMPCYHRPSLFALYMQAVLRLRVFLVKAGSCIIPVCIIIGFLNAVNIDGSLTTNTAVHNSVLSHIGKTITPIFRPIGIFQDNWPATVGLLTGTLAKEVVIGTLNTLYSGMAHLNIMIGHSADIIAHLKAAIISIPHNLANIPVALKNPLAFSESAHNISQTVYGIMYKRFDGRIGAFAYLLFILLYFPCIATIAVIRRELGNFWAGFSVIWTTVIAYSAALIFYQAFTAKDHILNSLIWIGGDLVVLLLGFIVLSKITKRITE